MEDAYEELADLAERGALLTEPDTVLRGAAAAAYGRRLLMDATGTDNIEDARHLAERLMAAPDVLAAVSSANALPESQMVSRPRRVRRSR